MVYGGFVGPPSRWFISLTRFDDQDLLNRLCGQVEGCFRFGLWYLCFSSIACNYG